MSAIAFLLGSICIRWLGEPKTTSVMWLCLIRPPLACITTLEVCHRDYFWVLVSLPGCDEEVKRHPPVKCLKQRKKKCKKPLLHFSHHLKLVSFNGFTYGESSLLGQKSLHSRNSINASRRPFPIQAFHQEASELSALWSRRIQALGVLK